MNKSISFKNGRLVYHISGEGKPVVLIHGFAEDKSIWNGLTTLLEKEFLVIIPDLPGSGESETVSEISIELMAEAIHEILGSENIGTAIVIGHSMGGYVTLALAEKYPSVIESIGLFHSTAYADSEEKKNARRKNIGFMQTHGALPFLKQSIPGLFSEAFKTKHPEIVEEVTQRYSYFNPSLLSSYYEAMIARPDRTNLLRIIEKPVLFIIGKQDNAVPFDDSMRLCHLPSLSYIHILENAGHMGMLEEPELSGKYVRNFCATANR